MFGNRSISSVLVMLAWLASPLSQDQAEKRTLVEPRLLPKFLTAGIEVMATVRKWHAALQSALENGIPVTAALLAPYRAQAITSLPHRLRTRAGRHGRERTIQRRRVVPLISAEGALLEG